MTTSSDNNSQIIRHCPQCAATNPLWPTAKHLVCSACGFTLYLNVAAAVAVIIEHEARILFGVRKNEPGRGLLDLPGGFADPGETAEECARREVLEETGLVLTDLRYFTSFPNRYLYRHITYDTLDLIFTARFTDPPEATAGDDLSEVLWLAPDSIHLERIAFPSLREAVRLYLRAMTGTCAE